MIRIFYVLVVTSVSHDYRLRHASIHPREILNNNLQQPLKLLINHPQTLLDCLRSEGGDVPVDNHPWASGAVIKCGSGGLRGKSYQTMVQIKAKITSRMLNISNILHLVLSRVYLVCSPYLNPPTRPLVLPKLPTFQETPENGWYCFFLSTKGIAAPGSACEAPPAHNTSSIICAMKTTHQTHCVSVCFQT